MKADLGGDRGATSTGHPNYEYEFYPYENYEVEFTIVPSQQDGTGIKMVSMKILLLVKKSILEKK